jgi:hypothetical protein
MCVNAGVDDVAATTILPPSAGKNLMYCVPIRVHIGNSI